MNYMDMYNKSNIRNPRYCLSSKKSLHHPNALGNVCDFIPHFGNEASFHLKYFGTTCKEMCCKPILWKIFRKHAFFSDCCLSYLSKVLKKTPASFTQCLCEGSWFDNPRRGSVHESERQHAERTQGWSRCSLFFVSPLTQNHPPKLAKGARGKKHRGKNSSLRIQFHGSNGTSSQKVIMSDLPPIGPKQFCTTWLSRRMVCNII